jgi:hypothetical protein
VSVTEAEEVRQRALPAEAPAYAVRRGDGRFLVQKTPVVGWHWRTSGVAWVRSERHAGKFTRTLARIAAVEHGGEVVNIERRS